MIRRLLAVLASLALAFPAAAQPPAPPAQQQTPINTYCWNGTAVALCGTPGTGSAGAAAAGTYANGSVALSTSPLQIWAANPTRVRALLLNNSGIGTAGGTAITVWCRWGTVAGAPAAAGGVGSFALQPGGGGRDDTGAGVNQSALNCLSESGTPAIYAEQY